MDPRYLGLIGKVNWLIDEVVKLSRRIGFIENNGGGGSSSLTIGDPVTGGDAHAILYEDASQNLAANASGGSTVLSFNETTHKFTFHKTTLVSHDGTAREVTFLDVAGNVVIDAATNIFTALQTVRLNSLGATTATGLTIQNTTAATSGHGAILQSSPALTFLGSIQNGLSLSDGFRMYYRAAGVGNFNLDYTSDGTTFTPLLTIEAGGGGSIFTGSVSSNGRVTGTTGLTATSGDLRIENVGYTINIDGSTVGNDNVIGVATLVNGTVTVNTSAVIAGCKIFLSLNTPGGTLGINYAAPDASRSAGSSFVINAVDSSGAVVTTDTSTIDWWIIHTH